MELTSCIYQQGYKIQDKILEKGQNLNKVNQYNKKWLNKKVESLDKQCAKSYINDGPAGELNTATCFVDQLFELGKNLK